MSTIINKYMNEINDGVLNLSNRCIDTEIAIELAEKLLINKEVKHLFLPNNYISGEEFIDFVMALRINTTIRSIDLSENNILDKGVVVLTKIWQTGGDWVVLPRNAQNTERLVLCDSSYIIIKKNDKLFNESLIQANSNLNTLKLSYNHITDEGAIALAHILKINSALYSLDLARNDITDIGMIALAESLKSNTMLYSLNLSNNNYITNKGAIALAEALKTNTSLTSLDLGENNNITNKGAIALAEALKTNTNLKSLYLDYTKISDEGAVAFADALKVNTTLEYLYIDNNKITSEGEKALNEALNKSETLQLIEFRTNF